MDNRNPEGYRKLLAYQKAQKLHDDVLEMVKHFPQAPYRHTHYQNSQIKTIGDLADQTSRSGRSTHKNIVEGWKRTTTKEYFDFLSFSIGSNAELKDDAADIVTGKYKELMGIQGVMGNQKGGRGVMGEAGTPSPPLSPFTFPLTYEELDRIPFYPLDNSLPPAVKIFLQAKEVDFLLHRLQQSLDIKMDQELTKPVSQRVRENMKTEKQNDAEFQKYLESIGLKRLEGGQYINSNDEKGDKGNKGSEGD